jgi:hypothetical protein
MESTDEEISPPLGLEKRGESLKNLPHHDSLRELELKEARAVQSRNSGEDIRSSSGGSNNKHSMVEPNPKPLSTPDNSNSSLLDGGNKRKGNIVAAADIEISPQEQLHIQDTIDPEIHRVKKKKTSKLKSFRRKPVQEDKTPRRIYFNDLARNASFKYL